MEQLNMQIILFILDIALLTILLWFSRIVENNEQDLRRPIFATTLQKALRKFVRGYFVRHFDVVLAVFYIYLAFESLLRIIGTIIDYASSGIT